MAAKKKPVTDENKKKKFVTDANLKIIFYLVLPLLLLPPFYRGLFFDYEADLAHMYTALVLGAYVFVRKDYIKLPRNLMDYAWIGLAAAYIISSYVAFNQRAAMEGALRVFNFFVIYWLLAYTVTNLREIKTALSVLFAAGVGVAFAGLGTAYGTFAFNGAYDKGLILSTLQYHNAAAIFLIGCGIIGFYLAASLDKVWMRVLAGGLNYIIIATAYGAGSRGAMLVAPIGLLLLIIGMPKEYRFRTFMGFLAVLIPFVITAKQVLSFETHSEVYYWSWLLGGFVIGCGCQYLVEKIADFSAVTRKQIIAAGGIGITVVSVGLILFMGPKIMPASIASRLSNFSLQDLSVVERFYFYRDAFEVVKDYPVLGVGGGGWNSAYTSYQSLLYYTTEVHSHPLQVWVETGTLGFLFYVLIWIGLMITLYRIMRKVESPEYRAAAWVSGVAALTVSMHSVIDFSLSLGAVAILMWALVGLTRGVERLGTKEGNKGKTIAGPIVRKAAGIILAGVFLVISGSLSIAAYTERQAGDAYNSGNVQQAIDLFEKAKKYDPVNYNYPMYLAQIYNYQAYQQKNIQLTRTAVENAKKAAELNKKNAQPLWAMAETYLGAQMPIEAAAAAEEAVQAVPWRQDAYNNLARVYLSSGNYLIQMGQQDNARTVLEKALTIPEMIDRQVAKLGPEERKAWRHGPIPAVDKNITEAMEQAEQMLSGI
ncbi:O-antigen ligase family protein [Phosphitispora fastidiosa]|uniref:O-antigen ligase family protein n=1 Tax=Phosphitispora fastidiosa TaxID=2837202 RepID=UPI001E5C429B|nr:O-antigen ligase family protein [Phosphitispora fastidiosa]MBU7008184.1 tetratricopeptide (TPR) repeat protein [Phosphitispora fastidiosa]